MATSLNKWLALPNWNDPRLRTIQIPGTNKSIRVRRAAAPLFADFCHQWNTRMPKRLRLDQGRQYIAGYNYRPANGGGLSNHSSGTAVDLRWDVLLPDNQRHMTNEEQKILAEILKEYTLPDGHCVLANGFRWRSVDEMHTELSQAWDYGAKRYTTMADVKAIKKQLRINRNGYRG